MVDCSNIFLLVGGGRRPLHFPHTVCLDPSFHSQVLIWDDVKARFIGEIRMPSNVLNLRATKKQYAILYVVNASFIIATVTNVYMYSRETLEKVRVYDTADNISGIIASNSNMIAFPRKERGVLQLVVRIGIVRRANP